MTICPPVNFGPEALEAARQARRLTNEQVWTELCVSDTTWYRWKKTGLVPAEHVYQLTHLLLLEMPADLPEEIPRTAWSVLDLVQGLTERVRVIEDHLGLDAAQSG